MTGRLLTLAQAAELLGCSLPTLRRRSRSGGLPCFRDGRIVRVHEADLERYVASRTRRPAALAVPPVVRSRRPGLVLAPGQRLYDLPDPLP